MNTHLHFLTFSFSHFLIVSLSPFLVLSQTGGDNTYEFLNIPPSARIAALGGTLISQRDDDIDLVVQNPASLSTGMNNRFGLTYLNYISDINFGNINYVKSFDKYGDYYGGLRYINYGRFNLTDETGLRNGEFSAGEYSFDFGWSKKFDTLFYTGIMLKTIYSHFENYSSFGQALDAGGLYISPGKTFTAAVVLKNLGMQYKSYIKKNKEPLPFEIQAGISKKLKHAPFRFNITLTHLERWDLTYFNPSIVVDTSQNEVVKKGDTLWYKLGYKIGYIAGASLRHLVLGTEILLTENFHLRVGYNYRLRQELKNDAKRGLTGFSAGFGFKIYKFNFNYGFIRCYTDFTTHYFTISTNLNEFQRVVKEVREEYR